MLNQARATRAVGIGGLLLVVVACSNPSEPEPLMAPRDVQVVPDSGRATVSWSAVASAQAYRAELTTDGEAPRVTNLEAAVTTASFTGLTLGATYQAVVRSLRGPESAASAPVSFRVPDPRGDLVKDITAKLATSFHGSARGMEYWYNRPDGYGAQTGVNYATLGCPECHVRNQALTGVPAETPCLACHPPSSENPAQADFNAVNYQKCNGCHGRQAAEVAMGLPDVHRAKGMVCGDCHKAAQVHGGEAGHNAIFDVLKVDCEGCHKAGGKAPAPDVSTAHSHLNTLSCQACHMKGSVTCYNCHFDDEVKSKKKVAYTRYADWLFLGNYRGKVYPLNFQSVEYEGKTFNAWGPFHGHAITRDGRVCNDCHHNGTVQNLLADGKLSVTSWNATTSSMAHVSGVIPVPPDYASAFRFDYVTKGATGGWYFLETGPDRSQMLYATPLNQRQMSALAVPH